MKKLFTNFWTAIAVISTFTACDKTNEGDLITNVDTRITSFKANNFEGTIDDKQEKITIFVPWSHDLTRMNVEVKAPQGALITPTKTSEVDLSKAHKYRVTNGNLYWAYDVQAKHPEITSVSIGSYKGSIDNTTRAITIKYPMGEPVTNLVPNFTTTEGSQISNSGIPADFTTPVTYTMSFAGENVTYTITLVPTSFKPIAFLGTAKNATSIDNEDEKKAYQWFKENNTNGVYVSFSDITEGKVNLSNYKAIWWHLDSNKDLPSEAKSPSVIAKMKDYYTRGGSFFFSSWAVQYVATLGITKDGKVVNNMWGENNTPFVIGDDWGICFKGNESHPIFKELTKKEGSNYVAFLLSRGVKAKGKNAIWNFEWGDYANDVAGWTTHSGAINLASFHWNEDMNRAGIFEYPKEGTTGKTICIGLESYDWFNEDNSPANTYSKNIEILTTNILEYLSN